MKVLKMIADWRYIDKVSNPKTRKDIPLEERDNNSWWYLHGELENYVGFDKATVTNCKSGGFARKTINATIIAGDIVERVVNEEPYYEMYFNGVVDVEIEGIERPCKGFFYTANERQCTYKGVAYPVWRQRGLVCFADDKEACEYAMNCFKTKEAHL